MKKFLTSPFFKISWGVLIFLTVAITIYTAVGLFKTYRLMKKYEKVFQEPPKLAEPTGPKSTELISISSNPFLYPDETRKIKVSFKNLSNSFWYKEGDHPLRLGSIDPVNLNDRRSLFVKEWVSLDRPAQMKQEKVGPGEIADFEFFIQAPTDIVAGKYREAFGLVLERKGWLADQGGRVDWDFYVKPTFFPPIDFVKDSPELSKINNNYKLYRPYLSATIFLILASVFLYQLIFNPSAGFLKPLIISVYLLLIILFGSMAFLIFLYKEPLIWGNLVRGLGFYAYGLILIMIFLTILDWLSFKQNEEDSPRVS